jgi:hypothetical protein
MLPRLALPALIFCLFVGSLAVGQSGSVTRGRANAGPSLEPPAPTGCRRGSAVDVTLEGAALADPLAAWLGSDARVNLLADPTTGKDSTQIRARIETRPDATIGMSRLRLATAGGISNFRPFCIDGLPEVAPSGGNHDAKSAQTVPVPCVVSGRVDAETSDYYRITVAAGQRVSFEVLGRRLGSPLDPIVRLRDADGRELPSAYSDDAPGLQADPRLTYVFASAGDYLIEVRDTTNKGGPQFLYRLRIGDFPCALTPLPAAARRGTRATIRFAGPQVQDVAPVEVAMPADPAVDAVSVSPTSPNGLPGWPVSLLVSEHDEFLAADGIGTIAQAQRLNPPCGVTGRFLRKGQRDHFAFAATKGQRFVIAAQTAELLSPADVYVTVRDGAGAELAHTDPHRPPSIEFTAPVEGNFFVVVEHLNYLYGPSEVYRLTVTTSQPGFDLTLAADRVAVPQGQAALLPVNTLIRRDFGGPIELSVVGPHGLSGSVIVPAGVQAVPQPTSSDDVGAPPPPPVAQLPVVAAPDLAPGAYQVTVMAKGVADGKPVVAFASTEAMVRAQMAGLRHPPPEWLRGVAVGVLPRPPVSLAALWERSEAVAGLRNKLVVVATRDPGFDGEIALSVEGLPAGVTAAAKPVTAGQIAATLDFTLNDRVGLGSYPFTVVGRTRSGPRQFTAHLLSPPLVVARPFDLKVDPNPLPIERGRSATLTVTAHRKGGYTGPIGLELRNLPADVTSGRATIAVDVNSAILTLTATAAAPLGSRGDVDVLGTARLGNQQAASPPFTVRVQEPPPSLTVKLDPDAVALKPGSKTKVKVSIERRHFVGPVAVTVEGLPARVSATTATVPPDQSTAEIELTAANDVGPLQADATVSAKAAVSATVRLNVRIEK